MVAKLSTKIAHSGGTESTRRVQVGDVVKQYLLTMKKCNTFLWYLKISSTSVPDMHTQCSRKHRVTFVSKLSATKMR